MKRQVLSLLAVLILVSYGTEPDSNVSISDSQMISDTIESSLTAVAGGADDASRETMTVYQTPIKKLSNHYPSFSLALLTRLHARGS